MSGTADLIAQAFAQTRARSAESAQTTDVSAPRELRAQPEPWPTPMRPEAFRGLAGDIVDTISPHSEADRVGLLATVLTLFGAHVGGGPHAVADGARHPAKLYTVLVGKTSRGRKGTAHANVATVLEAADSRFAADRVFSGLGSGEGLIAAVADDDTDARAVVFEPEYARLLQAAQRKGATLSAVVRDAWDRGRLQITTRTQPLRVDGSHVAMCAHITTDELRRALAAVEVANGFANRSMHLLVRRSKKLPEGGALTDRQIRALADRWFKTASNARRIGRLRRTDAARERWAVIYEGIPDNLDGMVGAVIARAEAQMLRLQVTYALLDGTDRIDVDHVNAAEAFWDYAAESASLIWGDATGVPIADRLLAAVTAAGAEGLDGTEQRAVFSGHVRGEDLDAARAYLADRKLVVTVTEQTGGRPRVRTYATDHAPEVTR